MTIERQAHRKLESKVIDFETLFRPYLGKNLVLAVKSDYSEVVASGHRPLEVLRKAKERGYDHPRLMKSPSKHYWAYIL